MADDAPGGLSLEAFESVSLEVGDWLWGTIQGAFNEKATFSQIAVDAVIGMIPAVGDVTGVRDLLAVVIGMSEDPKKREDKFQWMLLVVLCFSLIPVAGGALKGTGRLLLRIFEDAAKLTGEGARAAHLLKSAEEVVALLNRIGVGSAERFLVDLKFATYESAVVQHASALIDTVISVLRRARNKVGALVPASWAKRTDSWILSFGRLKPLIAERVPEAIKQLDQDLRELQAYIRSGGETTSRATAHALAADGRILSYTEELIVLEGKGATRSLRGGFAANPSLASKTDQVYKAVPGFPDITSYKAIENGKTIFPNVATYAGKIVNRPLQAEETIFRVFGKPGKTHGVDVRKSFATGERLGVPSFWGLGEVPSQAEAWRKGSAVLDEWNHNGFVLVGRVLPGRQVPACTGLIAEQAGRKLGAQYLEGGAKQAMLDIPKDIAEELNRFGDLAVDGGKVVTTELWGIAWEFRPTGWDDVNGLYGYLHTPGPGSIQTTRLGAKQLASKRENE